MIDSKPLAKSELFDVKNSRIIERLHIILKQHEEQELLKNYGALRHQNDSECTAKAKKVKV